jgi:hypothetical protein
VTKLRAHFEERFRYDEHGVPRVWRPDDDIDGAFKKAKDVTLALIPLYATIKPADPSLVVELPSEPGDALGNDEFDFAASLVVLSETRARELAGKVRRDADAAFVEAKRSTVSSVAQIPVWMYGMLVVLGWNEAMAVLFNPLYFATLLVALVTAYVPFSFSSLLLGGGCVGVHAMLPWMRRWSASAPASIIAGGPDCGQRSMGGGDDEFSRSRHPSSTIRLTRTPILPLYRRLTFPIADSPS